MTLGAAVAARGPLPVRSVLSLAAGLAEALSAAHAADVIHPGLNPAGVLLMPDGPRLIGTGISQAAYRGQAAPAGALPGMLDFTPPERAAGLEAGPASDMFSLGVVLLYAATGAWMSYFAWHLDQLPGELRPFIARCLATDPARRPTAAQFRTELAAAYPEAVRHVAWLPAWILAAGTAPPGGWPAQGWAPAPPATARKKYVILRNGAAAATVAGNVNHFTDDNLAPATTYDFSVIAYRGSARSQPSPDLRAATQTPPLSDAIFNSVFPVTEKVTSGGESVTGDADGSTWYDDWTFSSNCAVGPCTADLTGSIDGEGFTATLKPASDGSYFGTTPIDNYYYCGDSQTNYSHSTLKIRIRPAAATASGIQWQAAHLSGTAAWEIYANPNGNCGSGTVVMSIAG
jgi:serine/threonine protein kinase